MKELLEKRPGRFEVGETKWYQRGTMDYTPQLSAIMRQRPDMLDISGATVEESALIIKQSREMGYTGYIWIAAPMSPKDFAAVAGAQNVYKVIDGGIISHDVNFKVPAEHKAQFDRYISKFGTYNEFKEKYTKVFGKEPDIFAPYAKMQTDVLLQGIVAADSFDTEKVVAAFEAMPVVFTAFGIGHWGGKQTFGVPHQLFPPLCLSEIKGDGRAWIKLTELLVLP